MKKRPKKAKVKSNKVATPKGKSNQKGIVPLGDRVLVKPFSAEETQTKTTFGIIIPDTVSKEQPEQGKVIAVGEGRYEDGKLVPMKVKVGDTVIFSKYGFDSVKSGDDELYILKEDGILAIIK